MAVPEWLVFPAVVVFAAAVIAFVVHHEKKRFAAVADALAAHGLVVDEPYSLRLRGVGALVEGRRVRVKHYQRGSRRNGDAYSPSSRGATWTIVEAAHAAGRDAALHVVRENAAARLAKALGGTDVEVGDAAFDGAWKVTAKAPERVAWVLDATVRGLMAADPPVRVDVDGQRVRVRLDGRVWEAERLARWMRAAAYLASRMESAG